jgi:glutamyl-tRNA synthetase
MSEIFKTRFAPSPTGYLHLGGARTALFAYLASKANNGEFVIRVEDTDTVRNKKGAVDNILEALNWLNIHSDSEITFQSDRNDLYENYLKVLIEKNLCFACDCSSVDLEESREEQLNLGLKPKYNGKCKNLNLPFEKDMVIRFKQSSIGETIYDDLIYGTISTPNAELDDWVIRKSNGGFTYNFAATVDDLEMNITHVIRGNDHINNTPKQINLCKALSKKPLIYGHLPMILNEHGKKMSKRFDTVDVLAFKNRGYVSKAMVNYLAKLGWSHNDDEIFSIAELIKVFSTDKVQLSPAKFDIKKLQWFNKHYLSDIKEYQNEIKTIVEHQLQSKIDDKTLNIACSIYKDRACTLNEVADSVIYLFLDSHSLPKKTFDENTLDMFTNFKDFLINLDEKSFLEQELLKEEISRFLKEYSYSFKNFGTPTRFALSGVERSVGINEILFLLGKKESIIRIRRYL